MTFFGGPDGQDLRFLWLLKFWCRLSLGLMNKTDNDNDDENDEKIVVGVLSDAIICTLHYKA